jgi:hypothetical protein
MGSNFAASPEITRILWNLKVLLCHIHKSIPFVPAESHMLPA